MADPVIVICPKGQWTKVAGYMLIGAIHIVDTKAYYYYTYREQGSAPPTDDAEGVMFRGPLNFPDLRGIDVYVWCKENDGKVRVDNQEQQLQFFREALNIHDSDVHDETFSHFIDQETGLSTTLAQEAPINSYQIVVTDATGWAVGDYLDINFDSQHLHTYRKIVAINGTTFDINTRLSDAYPAGSIISQVNFSFNVIGTLADPQIYEVPVNPGEILHITALHFAFVHKAAADDTKFAGIPAITNGLVMRVNRNNGEIYHTIFNWANNREAKLDCGAGQVVYSPASPSGSYGTLFEFSIKQKTSSIIRLNGDNNDKLEMLVQDDLDDGGDMIDAKAKVLGHYEGEYI